MRRQRRDDLENQLNRGALWAVTYGDLMSYLMIFFLIMFSTSLGKGAGRSTQQRKYQESLASIQRVFGGPLTTAGLEQDLRRKREENMAQQLNETIETQKMGKDVQVTTTEEKVHLVLKAPVLFDSGEAELKPEAAPMLKEIAEAIKSLPNDIVVSGYTDNIPVRGGRYSSNWELSMARAYAVIRFFQSVGVNSSRMAGMGYGENKPVADNKTPEGRAANRRITIDLTRQPT